MPITPERDIELFSQFPVVGMPAEKEYLEIDGWIEGIEYLCILVKHRKTLVSVTDLIIRIRKLDHQRVIAFLHHTYTVRGHLGEGYGLLRGYALLLFLSFAG